MSYLRKPLRTFLDELGARKPTPGGGSVAALVGALASAQAAMCAEYSTGDKFKAVELEMNGLIRQFRALRDDFTQLMEADIQAYEAVSTARRLPKETESQKAERTTRMNAAVEEAVQVMEKVMNKSFEGLRAATRLSDAGNKLLASDVGTAAALWEASVQAAALQINANLMGKRDAKTQEIRKKAQERLQACFASSQEISRRICDILT